MAYHTHTHTHTRTAFPFLPAHMTLSDITCHHIQSDASCLFTPPNEKRGSSNQDRDIPLDRDVSLSEVSYQHTLDSPRFVTDKNNKPPPSPPPELDHHFSLLYVIARGHARHGEGVIQLEKNGRSCPVNYTTYTILVEHRYEEVCCFCPV
jgi:hypothetical protein